MCSLLRVILVLAVLSAGVRSSTAVDQNKDGTVIRATVEKGNNQGRDGGDNFFIRLLTALVRGQSDLHAELKECSKMQKDCKKPINEDSVMLHLSLIENGQFRCLETSFPDPAMQGFESVFNDTCNKMQTLSKCLKDGYARVRSCVCDVEIEAFSIIPISIMDVMHKECRKNKGKIDGLKNNGGLNFFNRHVDALGKCINDAFGRPSPLWEKINQFNSETLGHLLISRYDGVKALKRCLADIGKGKDPTLKYLESLTGLLLEEMRCVKDKSNTLAPCKRVVKN